MRAALLPKLLASEKPTPTGLHGRGGPGRGQGRKPGSKSINAERVRDLAGIWLDEATDELRKIAGLGMIEATYKSGKRKGEVIMEPGFNADGSPKLDSKRHPIMVPKMIKNPGSSSDAVRVMAIEKLYDRAAGKPTQPLANDVDNPLTNVVPTGKINFGPMPDAERLVAIANNNNEGEDEPDAANA